MPLAREVGQRAHAELPERGATVRPGEWPGVAGSIWFTELEVLRS